MVWAIRTGGNNDYITPSSANVIKDTNKKIEDFAEKDANGFGMTVMAMAIVFSALLLLGHRVFAGLCRIVGDEYTRNFKRGEVCVEKFDPRAPSASRRYELRMAYC